jgi:Tfp pilus assembly protein PilP
MNDFRGFVILGSMLLALGLSGCGDEDEVQQASSRGGPPGGGKASGKKSKPRKKPAEKKISTEDGYVNARWDKLRVHFLGLENDPSTGFVRTTIGTIRDPFEPMLIKYVPRVNIDEPTKRDEDSEPIDAPLPEIEDTPQPVAVGPTERFRTQDYELLMIRWGTSVNKALIQDPSGETFVITKDMKLGNNNGRVVDITRYDVTIKEDSRDEPILLSIQPGILRINTDNVEGGEKLFTNQVPPD